MHVSPRLRSFSSLPSISCAYHPCLRYSPCLHLSPLKPRCSFVHMSLISVHVSAVGFQGRQSPRRCRYRERDEVSRRRLADGAKSCALLVRARFALLCLVVCLFTVFPADVLSMMFILYCPSHAVHLDSRCCLCRFPPSRCYWSWHCFLCCCLSRRSMLSV
jgi:hypothetical protein